VTKFCIYRNDLREDCFILAHSFSGFSPWLLESSVSGHVVRQNIMVGIPWWSMAAYSMASRKRVSKKGVGKKSTL
jgi:hypothetical protein